METLLYITLVTFIAGVGGTGLGGAIGAFFRTESHRVVSLLLSFAAGVMLSIVCFSLLAESIEMAQQINNLALLFIVASVLLGVGIVYGLNLLIDRKTQHAIPHLANKNHPETHDDLDELIHSDYLSERREHNTSKPALFFAGVVMASAIALHNIPEGITIGAGFATQTELASGTGIILAVLIGFHNIPEGMAVSVPLINGGMKRIRAILVAAASGAPTIIGAWIGFCLGDIGPYGLMGSLSFASGAMLYVVFGEIIPQSILIYRSKLPAFSVIIGVLVGLLIIYA